MKSIRDIYKIGKGPSSSHTMGPEKRRQRCSKPSIPRPTALWRRLYGSLSPRPGSGHGTDRVLLDTLAPVPTEIVWIPRRRLGPSHTPTRMELERFPRRRAARAFMRVMSVGGGDIRYRGPRRAGSRPRSTAEKSFAEIADYCKTHNLRISDYVEQHEGREIWDFLCEVWRRDERRHARRA